MSTFRPPGDFNHCITEIDYYRKKIEWFFKFKRNFQNAYQHIFHHQASLSDGKGFLYETYR